MIKFSSPAAADFSMLDEHAQDLLQKMGHSPGTRGALAAEDVAPALQRLRAAVAATPAKVEEKEDEMGERQPVVNLHQRAYPLIQMLENAAARGKPVLWGV